MYSAVTVIVALIWAQPDDLNLLIATCELAVPMLGLAIRMVSVAFLAGNYLLLRTHLELYNDYYIKIKISITKNILS